VINNPLLNNPLATTSTLPYEEEVVSSPTFDYVDNRTRGNAKNLYVGNEVKQLGVDGLREEFNASDNDELRAAFGDFDNYLNYMTERQALINAGSYKTNWFDVPEPTDTASSIRGQEDLSRAERIADPNAGFGAQEQAYNEWQQSPENQQLMAKYGLDKPMVNQDGDQYAWNGSSYVKTGKVDDHAGIGDYAKIIGAIGLGIVTGGAASAALASSSLGASLATGLGLTTSTVGAVGGAALGSVVSQGAMTGKVDPMTVLQSALTAGVLDAANVLQGANDALNLGTLDGSNIDDLLAVMDSDTLTSLDNSINGISNALGVDYNTALKVVQGVATGGINGADPEAIATAAGTAITTSYATDWMKSQLDDYELGNLFDEGTTTINGDALESVVNAGLKDAIGGDLGAGTVYDALKGYYKNEGSLSFLDPNIELPSFDFTLQGGGTLPDLSGIEDAVRKAGNYIADKAEPVKDAAIAAGDYIADKAEPAKDALIAAGDVINDEVIQPAGDALAALEDTVSEAIPSTRLPEGPSGPDMPELPDAPELPDTPSGMMAGGGGTGGGSFTPKWSELFQYTTLTPYQKKQLAPYKDYVQQAKGMLS
jgi:hypothetical protein